MATILLDDVTKRVIESDGIDPVEWCAMLPTARRGAEKDEGSGSVSGSWILLGDARHPVYDTYIRLSDAVRYTRGSNQPGPQLIIEGQYAETIRNMLIGGPAMRVHDHPALSGSTVVDMFGASGYSYVDLAMDMHCIPTVRDLEAERRDADIAVDRLLARSGSVNARQRLADMGVGIWI